MKNFYGVRGLTTSWLVVLLLLPPWSRCCRSLDSRRRQGKGISLFQEELSGNALSHGRKVTRLNREGDADAVTNGIFLRQGEPFYGSLRVPYSYKGDLELTVTASWSSQFSSTPMWIFIKKGDLPTEESFDKTSVSFVSRGYSRLRVDPCPPGEYFIMLQPLTDLAAVSLSVEVAEVTPPDVLQQRTRSWPSGFARP